MKAPVFKIGRVSQIVWFDTEQSKSDIRRMARMVKILAQEHICRMKQYCLRGLSPPEKLFLMINIVNELKGNAMIIIDNLRDCLYDINNQKEALQAILVIQQMVDLGHHCILVLHVTRGSEDAARGAVGTEAINRAENVVNMIKNGNITIVRPVATRGKTFEEFAFGVDQEGVPSLVEDWVRPAASTGKVRQRLSPSSISDQDHLQVLKRLFLKSERAVLYRRVDFVKAIRDSFEKKGVQMGDSKVREFVKYFLQKKWILDKKAFEGNRYVQVYGVGEL